MQYRVLITGSRQADPDEARAAITQQFGRLREFARERGHTVVIIHGGARGVDSIADVVAKQHQFTTVTVYPQWDDHPGSPGTAAYSRNVQMVEEWLPEVCLAFNAGTRGTQHQIDICRKRGVPVREIAVQATRTHTAQTTHP